MTIEIYLDKKKLSRKKKAKFLRMFIEKLDLERHFVV